MPLQVRDDHLLQHYDDLDDVGDHCDLEDLGIMVNLHIIFKYYWKREVDKSIIIVTQHYYQSFKLILLSDFLRMPLHLGLSSDA